jgi:chromosomal replication initiator protein
MRVLYINSEEFSNDYINAIQNSNITQFHNHYRSFDVLIMDDIQFLSGKTKTQDTFFHTFNALHQKADKQIIIALDKPIDEVQDLDERLKSRLKWGLTVNIERPDFELRHSIVKKKAQDNGIDIPEEIIEYIATNVTNNIRELEGTLNGYTARVTFEGVPHSVELAKTVISGIAKNDPKKMTIEDIKKLVSEYYKIPTTEMESKSRKHEIALSRQMSMYLAKQLTQLSLKSIGSAFGGRDHSTVLHSCTQIENYLVTDKSVKNAYEYLLKTLKSMY